MTVGRGSRWSAQVGRVRPVGLLWAVWGVLTVAAYGRPVWTSTRLLLDPIPAGHLIDAHLRARATVTGAWLEICCGLLAIALAGFSQLERASLGLRPTMHSRLVLGRGFGAGAAYLFILSAASAMTASALSSLHVAQRVYPGAGQAADSPELARAFLFGSVSAGIGEELLLFAIPIALARRSKWPPAAILTLLIALRLAIHTYYGWGSLFVLLWIPAGYALYRAAGSIWPFVIAHALYDGIQFSIDSWPAAHDILVSINLAAALLGAVVALVGYNRYWRDRETGRRLLPTTA